MNNSKSLKEKLAGLGIAALCFGYFASYVPYAMGIKLMIKGKFAGMDGVGFSGFEMAPVTVLASTVGMFLFITFAGWWKHCTQFRLLGISLPRPRWFTFISGICTAGIIITTTLAYAFSGISIVFAMLLMRGGVLVLAPVVDLIARRRKRKIYWPSWVAALLSIGALFVSFADEGGKAAITLIAGADITLYLLSYFVRFIFMSNRAKSDDGGEMRAYFAEEQLTANPFLLLVLFIVGLIGSQMSPVTVPAKFWAGFTVFPFTGYFLHGFLIGLFSYGTGLFGSLIFLDKRENTFCVPANRCSSVIAGVVATYLLAIFYGQRYPSIYELVGVALILGAIVFLSYRSIMEKRRVAGAKGANAPLKCCAATEAK